MYPIYRDTPDGDIRPVQIRHINRPVVTVRAGQRVEIPTRIIVTRSGAITADEFLSSAQARAFFPWMARTYPSHAGAAESFRADTPRPAAYDRLRKEPVAGLRAAFDAYYKQTYTDRNKEPF